MKPPKPSPFFQPAELSRVRRGLNPQTRRALAWIAIVAMTAVAVAGTIYFTMPRETRAWKVPRQDQQAVKARAVTTEEGAAGTEIKKNDRVHRLRVRKVGEEMVIEDVTPDKEKAPKKPWWRWK